MDDLFMKAIQPYVGTGLSGLMLIAALWLGGKLVRPNIVQADANAALFNQLKETIAMLQEEIKTLKKQRIILERLALQAGIDVEQAYRDEGLL